MKKTTFYNFLPTKAEEENSNNRHGGGGGGGHPISSSEVYIREIGPDTPTVNYLDNNYWTLRKVLTFSDIDDKSSLRLPEGFQEIQESILRYLQRGVERNVLIGIQEIIRIKDIDTGSYHHMILSLEDHMKTNSFFIKGHWKTEFVLRRNLQPGFLIGFRWNVAENCLDFSLLSGEQQLIPSSLTL